jgi:hypothetical protein
MRCTHGACTVALVVMQHWTMLGACRGRRRTAPRRQQHKRGVLIEPIVQA